MADAILKDVHASRLFDLQGLVAVVTGGASVGYSNGLAAAEVKFDLTGHWGYDNAHLAV